MKNKKGVTSQIARLAMIAISAVILFGMIVVIQENLKESFRDKDCKSSVLAKTHTSFQEGAGGFVKYENEMNLFCPIYQAILGEEEGVLLKQQEEYKELEYQDDEITSEDVNKILANELAVCWNKFGAGQVDAFYVPENIIGEIFNSDKKIGCRTCTIINFDLEEDKTFSGFKDYLKRTKVDSKSQREDAPGEDYYSFIAEKDRYCQEKYLTGENCWENFAEEKGINTNLTFYSSEDYYVVFIRENPDKEQGTLNAYIMNSDTRNEVCYRTLPYSCCTD